MRNSSGGIGFLGMLTITFIALKLTSVIDWSWWWVLSPLWISTGFIFCFFIVVLGIAIRADVEDRRNRKRWPQ